MSTHFVPVSDPDKAWELFRAGLLWCKTSLPPETHKGLSGHSLARPHWCEDSVRRTCCDNPSYFNMLLED